MSELRRDLRATMGQGGPPANRGARLMADWRLPEPVAVREIENDWIETPDGARLAVSLWLPDAAERAPVVLESIPYRKRDSTRGYSSWWGRKLAERGVAYARLDCRGSGDSGGLLLDEYLPQEQADNVTAIEWLAAQPWCNGAVGMRGVSWGGFSTLQAAALGPPALKAIMPMCASDRRYTDDAHYVGGAFALTGLKWATSFKAVMAGPPDPEIFGPGWEAEWMKRLEAAPAIAAEWLSHQREDDYWRQGSVGFDPAAIRCPVYLVGGWLDPYNEMFPRLLERLQVPAKALIGPWTHGYPSPASPGPGLVWEVEEVAWWRHWLAGDETGVMDGPRIRVYLPEQAPARAEPGPLPGRWIAEPTWPPRTETLKLGFEERNLREGPSAPQVVRHDGGRIVGLQTPEWVPFAPAQYPQEQSVPDDMFSLPFYYERRAEEPLDLFGVPRVRLCVAASAPVAKLSVRLLELDRDHRSWLVSYGVLNLTRRNGHAVPEALVPDEFYNVEVPLYLTGRRIQADSYLGLCISEHQWPLIWPSPETADLKLDLAGCSLELPVRPASIVDPPFPIPIAETATGRGRGDPEIRRQYPTPGVEAQFDEMFPQASATISDTGTTIERVGPNVECRLMPGDPNSGRWRVSQSVRYLRGDWDCALEAEAELTSDATTFHIREKLTAKRGEAVVFEREHRNAIPRNLM